MLNETSASTFDFAAFANLQVATPAEESSVNEVTLNETSEEDVMLNNEFMAQFDDDMTTEEALEEANAEEEEISEWVADIQDEFDLFGDVTDVSQQHSDESYFKVAVFPEDSQTPVVNDTITTTFLNLDSSTEDKNVSEPEVEKVAETIDSQPDNGVNKPTFFSKLSNLPVSEQELMNVDYKNFNGETMDVRVLYLHKNPITNAILILADKSDIIVGMRGLLNDEVGFPHSSTFTKDDVVLSPFVPVAQVEGENGKNCGTIVKYYSKLGKERLLYLAAVEIDNNKFINTLIDNGFHVASDARTREQLKNVLKSHNPSIPYKVPYVDKLGYSDV
jgi:hypothetical protein